ncbi:AAA+ ATPase [Helicosporidium sp. ATCC 50920]|nr:AAA+ ATPase [Helicosporidium sp. ATCC 50920]|eukprot:KDD77194.1 AAA+ ATPase [Helicosporidium sp. ATCC 50920]
MATDLVDLLVHSDKPQKSSRVKELLEKYITGEMLGWIPLAGNEFKLQFLSVVVTCIVAQALPSGHGEVASTTIVSIKLDDEVPSTAMERALAAAEKHGAAATSATKRALQQESSRGLDAVGGYNDTIRQLKELVLLPMTNASLFASVGLQLPRGVLLYGPPGTGKSLLARSLAHEAKATLFVVNGPETLSQYMGESESAIAGIFAAARALAPSIIFFDEADAVMAGRNVTEGGGSQSATSARLNLAIAQQLDALSGHQCIVLAATNRSETIDESLRRPGRFDREVEILTWCAEMPQWKLSDAVSIILSEYYCMDRLVRRRQCWLVPLPQSPT